MAYISFYSLVYHLESVEFSSGTALNAGNVPEIVTDSF